MANLGVKQIDVPNLNYSSIHLLGSWGYCNMILDSWKKLKFLEKTHACTKWTQLGFEPGASHCEEGALNYHHAALRLDH